MQHKNNKSMEQKKTPNSTTIEISIETLNKLHSTADALEQIFHKRHVTPEQVIKCFYVTNPLDEMVRESL